MGVTEVFLFLFFTRNSVLGVVVPPLVSLSPEVKFVGIFDKEQIVVAQTLFI